MLTAMECTICFIPMVLFAVYFLIAHQMNPAIIKMLFFVIAQGNKPHIKVLEFLKVKAILNLGLRLGEGTGCAIAFQLSNQL
jgi:nicotinate-nucleotide--dimethylbenzimidazole phosphoribosyltransferase